MKTFTLEIFRQLKSNKKLALFKYALLHCVFRRFGQALILGIADFPVESVIGKILKLVCNCFFLAEQIVRF